jgi:hypothetical protein
LSIKFWLALPQTSVHPTLPAPTNLPANHTLEFTMSAKTRGPPASLFPDPDDVKKMLTNDELKKQIGQSGGTDVIVTLVHAVKHGGCHKARLCANGNLTGTLINSICLGVAPLKSSRVVAFLAEISDLEA